MRMPALLVRFYTIIFVKAVVEPVDCVNIPPRRLSGPAPRLWITPGSTSGGYAGGPPEGARLPAGAGRSPLPVPLHRALCPEAVHKALDAGGEVGVLRERAFDPLAGVHDGRVVAAPELLADAGQGRVRQLAGQVHRDLAGEGDPLGSPLGLHLVDADPKELRHGPLDRGDRDRADAGLREQLLEHLHG